MAITQDASAPLVVVVGATGIQGGSVIRALAESNKPYRIRGITRDPSKPAAQEVAKKGVELVAVSLTPENKDQAFKVFEGATYAFAVTNFWDHLSKEREIADGRLLVDAAKAAKVKLLVWSGLEDYAEVSGGKYTHVDHFDGKAEVTRYAKEVGVPVANVQAAGYMSNYLTMSAPKKQADGSYLMFGLGAPENLASLVDAHHDYGLFVRAAIESGDLAPPFEMLACGEVISNGDIAKQMSEITGKKIVYVQSNKEQFMGGAMASGMSEVVANEIAEMLLSIAEFGYYGKKNGAAHPESLVRAPRTWAEYVKVTDWSKVLN